MLEGRHPRLLAAAAALLLAACGDDPAGPGACREDTGSVAATVELDGEVRFSWEPGCGVALLLVEEEDGTDMWGMGTDVDDPAGSGPPNPIEPPVTYGVAPPGVPEFRDALALEAGVTYQLVLWRVLPGGAAAQCMRRIENFCLVAVQPFSR